MFLKENVILAVAGLRANKIRAFLTMLGIIIGIGSVIAIVSIGDAVTNNVSDTMAGLGANNIYVYVAPSDNDSIYGQMNGSGTEKMDDSDLLTFEQIEQVRKKFSNEISDLALYESVGSGKAQDGHKYANVTIYGANPGFGSVENVDVQKGRFLTDRDISGNRSVAVVSDKLVSNMFGSGTDPLGQKINVDTSDGVESYTIVGVYKYVQQGFGGAAVADKDISTTLYIPVSVAKETSDNQNYSSFEIRLKNVNDTHAFTDRIESYMKRLYANNPKYTCSAYNMENMLSSVTSMMGTISIAIAAIAAIALIVGGIGVMNIMLVSVTERTREIGTRKALGARSSYIRMQFIVESVIICVIGGIIGIITGIGLAAAGVALLKMKLVISVPIIFISVGFSMLIGIFFGYYPAKKASQLDPIEALRYE
ncbi:putative ABC transporter permease YknZ [Caprobacter fermentans]|uniref:ABC transporter permease n=1 Tax=Caproicibacter fermentans TaxID=2576756 RepID=A0A6N8HX57_9FIRM|nr:ABC transporter permease [Caproicibacter fermentans]MVB10087.1 putative ABC transporter permease YknZ [Caproicibacter fermentans]OCN03355.1 ABC transporter permease [Clostridium sp. W14A]QNK40160.1 ABC transporter permease [Caproicibacter fermentans]